MPLIAALGVGLAIILIGWPRPASTQPDLAGWSRLLLPAGGTRRRRRGPEPPTWVRLIPPGVEQAIRRVRQSKLKGPDLLAQQLRYAGLGEIILPEQFVFLRVLTPIGLFAALLVTYLFDPAPFRLILALAGGGVGTALPDHWLKQQVRRKQEALRRELPSILTTLGVLLDAGLNLVPALEEISRRKEGALADILDEALRQTSLGSPIQQSLQTAADQCGVQEFTLFVSVLTQSMTKGGGGISEAVHGQSQHIWALRQQQVQEKGQEMSQDLFFVLLFLAFPAIALFLLGPVGLSLYHTFFK